MSHFTVDTSSFNGQLLHNYEGPNLQYCSERPQLGLYSIEVTSLEAETCVQVSAADNETITPFLQIADNENLPRHIRVKFDFKNQSVTIKWTHK